MRLASGIARLIGSIRGGIPGLRLMSMVTTAAVLAAGLVTFGASSSAQAASGVQPAAWSSTLALDSGTVSTLAGSGSLTSSDGMGVSAGVPSPSGLHVVGGSAYFGASGYIRKVDLASGAVSSVVGNGSFSLADNTNPLNARVCNPIALTDDGSSLLFIDQCGMLDLYVRKMSLVSGAVTTLVTRTDVTNMYSGLTTGPGGAVYASSNSLSPAVVVRIDPVTGARTQVATLPTWSGNTRTWLAADSTALWVATDGCTATSVCGAIFKVDPASGSVTHVATGLGLLSQTLVSAGSYLYTATAPSAPGISVAGAQLKRITKSDGSVRLIAGSGVSGYQNGDGAEAWFSGISGLDTNGSALWVADRGNHRIRKIVSGAPLPAVQPTRWSATTTVTSAASSTVAGGGSTTVSDGIGTAAGINSPGACMSWVPAATSSTPIGCARSTSAPAR